MVKFGTVYVHINKLNGKVYVGQTTQDVHRRFRKTEKTYATYKNCSLFYRALKKYSWDAFETSLIVSVDSQKELDFMEEKVMKFYNSIVPHGYNLVERAVGKVIYTKAVRHKISLAASARQKGAILPDGMKKRIPHLWRYGKELKICSDCEEALSLPSFGKDDNWDGLNRICLNCARIRKADYDRRTRKVLSSSDWSLSYQNRAAAISQANKLVFETRPELRANLSKKRSKPTKAINIVTGEELSFPAALAAKTMGFNNSHVSQAIKNGTVYKGYRWHFV